MKTFLTQLFDDFSWVGFWPWIIVTFDGFNTNSTIIRFSYPTPPQPKSVLRKNDGAK